MIEKMKQIMQTFVQQDPNLKKSLMAKNKTDHSKK